MLVAHEAQKVLTNTEARETDKTRQRTPSPPNRRQLSPKTTRQQTALHQEVPDSSQHAADIASDPEVFDGRKKVPGVASMAVFNEIQENVASRVSNLQRRTTRVHRAPKEWIRREERRLENNQKGTIPRGPTISRKLEVAAATVYWLPCAGPRCDYRLGGTRLRSDERPGQDATGPAAAEGTDGSTPAESRAPHLDHLRSMIVSSSWSPTSRAGTSWRKNRQDPRQKIPCVVPCRVAWND